MSTKSEPEDEAEEGLGGLPSNISSISSLLLFNTTENLYGQEIASRKREGGREGRSGHQGQGGKLGRTEGGRVSCRDQLLVQQMDGEGWAGRKRGGA